MTVGHDVTLLDLRDNYDAVLFAYGASKDRELGIPGEDLDGIYSARAFVGWYNGLPEYVDLSPNLQAGDTAVVIGQGNVALDVARVLLSGADLLKNTDISEQALQQLADSTIKNVRVVGRRGPLQASFTIKEVRELMNLQKANFKPIDLRLLPGSEIKLPRTQKRLADLFKKQAAVFVESETPQKSGLVSLDFMRAPVAFMAEEGTSGRLASTVFEQTAFREGEKHYDPTAQVLKTEEKLTVNASTVFRSIGYKAEALPGMADLGISFDTKNGTIPNLGGRVLGDDKHIPGLYCAGWVKRGPTGVIATTMEDGFATAELIAEDWGGSSSGRRGWEALKARVPHATNWQDWLKIDTVERERGKAVGKEREKIIGVADMLNMIR